MNTSSAPGNDPGATRLDRHAAVWSLCFVVAVIWPLLLLGFPAMQDLPNHAARVYVLLQTPDSLIGQHFLSDWRLVPNLAWDVFGVFVGQVLSLDLTVKFFIISSLALTVAGVFLLHRALSGQWSYAPLLAVPFLFNAGYSKGFLSFNFGVGLALIACAWWIFIPECRWLRRLIVASLFSLALFYSHLVVWGCYGVFVLAVKLAELSFGLTKAGSRSWLARVARDSLQALPPIALVAIASALNTDPPIQNGEITSFAWPWHRLPEMWHVIDGGKSLPALVALALAAAAIILCARTQSWVLDRRGVIAAALLFVLFLVMPDQIYNTYWVVWRLALFGVFVLVASIKPPKSLFSWQSKVSLTLALAATLIMSVWQAYSTHNTEVRHQQFSQLIKRIPEGSTLFAAHTGIEAPSIEFDRIGLFHFGSFAVFENDVMVQSLFSSKSQQPIRYSDPRFQNEEFNGDVFLGTLVGRMTGLGRDVPEYLRNFQWIALHGPSGAPESNVIRTDTFAQVAKIGEFRLFCRVETDRSGKVCPDGSPP